MGSGIYISVKGGTGGTIRCVESYSGQKWSNSTSTPEGYGGFTGGTATFTAEPDPGYAFSQFETYICSGSEKYSAGTKDRTLTSNPLTLSSTYAGDGSSYLVRATFIRTTTYHSVRLNLYKSGAGEPYDYENYEDIEDGSYFDVAAHISSIPSGYTLDYVYYGGQQYSYYPTFTVTGDMTISVYFRKARPDKWDWTSTIAAGNTINISAVEWNRFTANINAVRVYRGLSSYGFTTVNTGQEISPSICNEARSAINTMASYQSSYTMPSAVTSSLDLPASFFNGLKNVLNAIP